MSVVLFELHLLHWKLEQVSLCTSPLRLARFGLQKPFYLSGIQSPLIFTEIPLPGISALGRGAQCGAGTPHYLRVTTAETSLPFINPHTTGVGPAWSASLTLLFVLMWLLFYILSSRNFIQLILR